MPHAVFLEIANALIVALLISDVDKLKRRPKVVIGLVGLWSLFNVLVLYARSVFQSTFLHVLRSSETLLETFVTGTLVRLALCATTFLVVLYLDVKYRNQHIVSFKWYLKTLLKAILYVAPTYPCLVVLISFGFFLLISIFEFIDVPTGILNLPIYYGTLYGPFVAVYARVRYLSSRAVLLPA